MNWKVNLSFLHVILSYQDVWKLFHLPLSRSHRQPVSLFPQLSKDIPSGESSEPVGASLGNEQNDNLKLFLKK